MSERLFNKDVPFITYIIHDKNMKNGRAVTVYKPTQEYYILFELIKFRRLPSTFPDIGITVISEGLEPSPSDVSVTQDVLMDIKTPPFIENNNPDYYKDDAGTWIPVSERLPEYHERVLFFGGWEMTTHIGYYVPELPQWTAEDGSYYHGKNTALITHWMPLPEPPEAK